MNSSRRYILALAVAALGVVYGDIGTSPLYAVRECFSGTHAVAPTHTNVLGVLSLIFWSITVLVSIKYVSLVLRADNKGEGGILALVALAFPEGGARPGRAGIFMVLLGLFGTALLYGDGIITPAISVLSAVEGLNVATKAFDPYIIPITVAVLVALFSVQSFGTDKVGDVFGRVMIIWFLAIALLGIRGIVGSPQVFAALNPVWGFRFFLENGTHGLSVLGSIVLAFTGAEALYADMGHFGRRPICRAWFGFVFPALVLNYFGQGALLLSDPSSAFHPFYHLAPDWAVFPMVVLATSAAVIASQALVSGAFSLTMHAMQLGYCPRLKISHTSSQERGQIYIAHVNWFLMFACVGLVLGFRSSSNLAAAYGIAVTLTMLITTCIFYVAAQRLWGWTPLKAALVCLPFFLIELCFVAANMLKIAHGGWFPLAIAGIVFTLMTTWKTGRKILGQKLQESSLPLNLFFEGIAPNRRVQGTAVYLSGRLGSTPISLLHNLKHNRVLHERVIVVTIIAHETPWVARENRLQVENLPHGFYRVTGHYGFMEEPDVPVLLRNCSARGVEVDPLQVSYFLSKETILPSANKGMALWREKLFALMSRNAVSASSFFKLPPNRVIELGMQIEI